MPLPSEEPSYGDPATLRGTAERLSRRRSPRLREVDRAVPPELAYPLAQRLELVVGVIRVVMEQEEPPRGREPGEIGDVMGAECPNPARCGYSSSVYWQSWIRTSTPVAISNPDTHSGSTFDKSTERRLVIGQIRQLRPRPRSGSRRSGPGGRSAGR